jgi:integrase
MADKGKFGPLRIRPRVRNGRETGSWFVDVPGRFALDGKRKRLTYDTKREAQEAARQKLREIQMDGMVQNVTIPPSGVTLHDVAARWHQDDLARVRTLKKKAVSLKSNLYRLKSVLIFLGKDDVSKIDKRRLVNYQAWRLELGRSPSTINSEIVTLGLLLKWAKEHGLISDIPKVEQIPAPRKRIDIPTPDEVAQIIAALPQPLDTLVLFLAETGCRKGEAFHLEWDDVDEISGSIHIQSKEGWTPKTAHSERMIPLSENLLAELRKLPKKGRYVFPGRDPNKPLDNFRKALASAVNKAGVSRNSKPMNVTPHVLRKFNATHQAMRNVPESVLQDLLGHAPGSKVTKQHYIHAQAENKRAAVFELPRAFKKTD